MKFFALFILGVSLQASAANPLMHFCALTHGSFRAAVVDDGDQVGFCQFGSAIIDAQSILSITTENNASSAAQAALNEGASCDDAGGSVLPAKDLEGHEFSICQFGDGSSLEVSTLQHGVDSGSNAHLVKALKTRF
jgi:putative hemolysin